jgi:hypothetical protein
MKSLSQYSQNIYSQNGEDGIIREILRRLEIKKGQFVEFGAWDGKHLSNTFLLCTTGWNGVYIEYDEVKFEDLKKTQAEYQSQLQIIRSMVTPNGETSLDSLLAKTSLKKDFDLLSIDIDGEDYLAWESFNNYTPAIVIIEVNSSIPLHIKYIGVSWQSTNLKIKGSSFSALVDLGYRKGYVPVCHTGNLIFVRKDLINKLNLPLDELINPFELFYSGWVQNWDETNNK